jgi:hypothetical protein
MKNNSFPQVGLGRSIEEMYGEHEGSEAGTNTGARRPVGGISQI